MKIIVKILLAILIVAAVALVSFKILGEAFIRDYMATREIPIEAATKELTNNSDYYWQGELMPLVAVLRAARSGGRDPAYYYQLALKEQGNFDDLKKAVLEFQPPSDKCSASETPPLRPYWRSSFDPDWWIADKEIIEEGFEFSCSGFGFSVFMLRSKNRIYLLKWTT